MSGGHSELFHGSARARCGAGRGTEKHFRKRPLRSLKKSKKFHFRCRRLRTGLSRSVTRSRQSILYTVCSPSYSTRMNS